MEDRKEVEVTGDRGLLALVVVAVTIVSLGWMLHQAEVRFVPYFTIGGQELGYDACRYHLYAASHAERGVLKEIFREDDPLFYQMGYPIFLVGVYEVFGTSPVVGCFANWVLWILAGIFICRVVKVEGRSVLLLYTFWVLYPEAVGWSGTTSKETLVAFLVASSFALACSEAKVLVKVMGALALGLVAYSVRQAVVPLVVLLPLLSFRKTRSLFFAVAVLATLVAYVLEYVGGPYSDLGEVFEDGLSEHSILARAGSESRVLDLAWIPVRALANFVAPLYQDPRAMPSEFVLDWFGAAIVFLSLVAFLLRAADGAPWTGRKAVAAGGLAYGAVLLGLSGIVHPRYRSIVAPLVLYLGYGDVLDEVAERGWSRLVAFGVGVPVLAMMTYRVLKG